MKPTGVGKEMKCRTWNDDAELELKTMIGAVPETIPRDTFVTLYNQDRSFNPGMPPRVFMRSNDNFTTFKFKSSDFVYQTILDTESLGDNRVFLMNISDNLFRL